MFYSTRSKLVVSFISVAALVGIVSLIVGGQLLYKSVLNEAGNRIRQDLNVARMIYDDRVNVMRLSLESLVLAPDVREAFIREDRDVLLSRLEQVGRRIDLDYAGAVTAEGRVVSRSASHDKICDPAGNPMIQKAVQEMRTVAGTLVLNPETQLPRPLILQTDLPLDRKPVNPAADDLPQPIKDISALSIGAAAPVIQNGRIIGVIYGGKLLNRNHAIVDKIGDTVFKNEVYQGHNVGTATIFFNNLRISTNVRRKDGERAIGTLASPEVTRRVLVEGKHWMDRAFVVNDWYITAYEPISDIFGRRVGMLYVGVLEAKYLDVRRRALWVFTVITLAGTGVAVLAGWVIARRITRPVNQLIRASMEISEGNLAPDIGPVCKSDIGVLQQKFLTMTEALVERDQQHREESEKRLIQSEKQASIGKLAAGVAHEINNPLTAVLTFTHLMLRRNDLPDDVRADLQTVALQTERVRKIVKGLLDFSRQTRLEPEPVAIDRLVEECVRMLENQALVQGVSLGFEKETELPLLTLDRSQFQSVLVNMIINALDATGPGGKISLSVRQAGTPEREGVEIRVEDTGEGIPPEHLDRLFDPFFTTKEVGKGTGLGLAVSAGVVARHGGHISVQSAVGDGACFRIWLPVQPEYCEAAVRRGV